MARILVSTLGSKSHILPFLSLVKELRRRGDEVLWICDGDCRELIEGSGASFHPARHRPPTRGLAAALDGLVGIERGRAVVDRMLVRPIRGELEDFREALSAFPADLLLGDSFCLAARIQHEGGGPPWAILNVTVCMAWTPEVAPHGLGIPPLPGPIGRLRNIALKNRVVKRAYASAYGELDEIRAELGLPPLERRSVFDHLVSPYLFLQPGSPAFEYPRSFPPSLRFIGPLLPPEGATGAFEPPPWWGDLDSGKPIVLLTQGTVANGAKGLIAAAASALGGEDFLVLATTGGSSGCLPPTLPDNFRVADFIPYSRVLPRVSAFVTNGGFGAVSAALAQGVPIVAAGATEEKPEICRRVGWSGIGIDLGSGFPGPGALRRAVRRVLFDPRYLRRAREVRADFASHDAAKEAADLIEATARSPVPRPFRP